MAQPRRGQFVAPGDWEREVPYDIRERTFQFAVRVRDFVHKMSIARKEARESRYWLRVVRAAILDTGEFSALGQESDELVRILSAIIAGACSS